MQPSLTNISGKGESSQSNRFQFMKNNPGNLISLRIHNKTFGPFLIPFSDFFFRKAGIGIIMVPVIFKNFSNQNIDCMMVMIVTFFKCHLLIFYFIYLQTG